MNVVVEDLRIRYERRGGGPPLILLHGNGGSHRSFDGVIDALSERFECFAVDARMHGRTTAGTERLTYPRLGRDALAFAERLSLVRPALIGYSDGGIAALEYAALSDNVDRVIAIGANWDEGGTTPEFSVYANGVLERTERWAFLPGIARKRERIKLMTERDRYDDWEALSRIKCPVLLMTGDRDVIPYEHTARMARAIPNAEICVVPECGHGVMKERRTFFLERADAFLSDRRLQNGSVMV